MLAHALLVGLLLASAGASRASAQVDPCDPALKGKQEQANPNGYRQRNDRCEGVFMQDVSATGNLLVASFTATLQGFTPQEKAAIQVEWKAPQGTKLNIRAYSLRPRLHYRMDTVQDAGAAAYTWPSDVVARYGLKAAEVGVVAWTSMTVGDKRFEPVYVPVAVRESQDGAWPSSQRILVVPPADLKEMYLTVSPVDASGAVGKPLRDGPLEYGYYPAGAAVRIDLPPASKPGLYLVQVAGELKGGGSAVSRFWIYQP